MKLIDFCPVVPFYTPWKHQETRVFLVFSGSINWEHCTEKCEKHYEIAYIFLKQTFRPQSHALEML